MKRTTLLFIVLGFLVITALWWFLLISPRNAKIDEANLALDDARSQETVLQAQIAQLRVVQDNELSFLFALGEMESSIPTDPELDAFLEDLTFLADTTGIEVSSISSAVPAQAEGSTLYTMTVALNFQGEYFEVLGFLYGLEDLERLVVVDTLSLNPVAAEEEVVEETTEEDEDAVEEPRQRPEDSRLQVSLSARLFTRSTVAVPVVTDDGEGDGGDGGDGS
ncbi:MAG: type 4a pilus biogenesis protein PilO [Acidimicrobiia bacterium]|nr:type 4a pilus biogenesis protein PilO [Acidimicrobiia bacterium]